MTGQREAVVRALIETYECAGLGCGEDTRARVYAFAYLGGARAIIGITWDVTHPVYHRAVERLTRGCR